ncbi:hypothetical protein FB567DRAFT_109636 [Paraphoma chrysanthemicola]|uniref:Uncharacterized protein n=1 Tax=Paraphoma chrysanthemicola TaxID=798071 RepID=A0A8K0QYR6_9PLEO|nr:hypothetical protein FB567DRAFT_109636 [Paraphoma chrysanthemicola]
MYSMYDTLVMSWYAPSDCVSPRLSRTIPATSFAAHICSVAEQEGKDLDVQPEVAMGVRSKFPKRPTRIRPAAKEQWSCALSTPQKRPCQRLMEQLMKDSPQTILQCVRAAYGHDALFAQAWVPCLPVKASLEHITACTAITAITEVSVPALLVPGPDTTCTKRALSESVKLFTARSMLDMLSFPPYNNQAVHTMASPMGVAYRISESTELFIVCSVF